MSRLSSLDVLRGLDMFFITGGATLIAGVGAAFGFADGWLARQMEHVPWTGLTHHDTIFPLFLFLAGASWPFSVASQRARGRTNWQIERRVLVRTALLFTLGISFGGIFSFSPCFRLMSVLGFIGLSWGASTTLCLYAERIKTRVFVITVLAIGYFLLLHFGINPGATDGADSYSKEWNIVRWLDLWLYQEHMMIPLSVANAEGTVAYEPLSFFSLPGGMLIALFGILSGSFLRSGRFTPVYKSIALALAGLALFALTLVLVIFVGVPIVKALWTVSFVSATIAYSLLLLALCHWIVDVKGWAQWTVVFDPIGKNSILAYLMMMTGVTVCIRTWLFGGVLASAGVWSMALEGLLMYLVTWIVCFYCMRKNIYLKV